MELLYPRTLVPKNESSIGVSNSNATNADTVHNRKTVSAFQSSDRFTAVTRPRPRKFCNFTYTEEIM